MTTLGPALPGMRCVEKLGSGGFSDVYLYERDQPRIKVAVKLLRQLDDLQRRQLVAEADTMAELAEHPYIVPVLGAGTAPDGRPYLVMRYYPPPDLGARVRERPMPVAEALRTGIQLASAVETAHRSGIIHRDIKPTNVLISSYGVPGLTDFGIAGRHDPSSQPGSQPGTQPGTQSGTQSGRTPVAHASDEYLGVSMPWSPPEVLIGRSNGTPLSDVYSLAATIWHLLVGRSPFSVPGANSEHALFTRILHSAPPATGRPDVPPSLDRLLQRAMSKLPDHRPATALELARLLQRAEKELGLPRTEIVVLETEPELTEPTERSGDGMTVMRRPVTVRPTAPDTTEPRPRRARAAVASSDSEHDGHTRLRPGDATAATHVTASRWAALGGAGVLLAAAVAVAVVLANKGGHTPAPLPTGGPTSLGDVLDDPLFAPTITASPHGRRVVFSAAKEQPGDAFHWFTKPAGGQAAPLPGETSVTVTPDPSGRTCVELQVVRGGQSATGDQCSP